jgi:drug/metabolite transporter (DMT)-like permease
MNTVLMVLVPVLIGVVGQFFLKYGMNQIGELSTNSSVILVQYIKVFMNPYVFIGMVFYFLSALLWLMVISKVPLSTAYPLISMSYIIVLIGSSVFFKESVSLTQWSGVFIVMLGIVVLSRG